MGEHARDARLDHLRREEFGQRRRHCLEQRTLTDEFDIGADREPRRRQNAPERDDVRARKSQTFAEAQPALDAALAIGPTVMVDEALAPGPPQSGIVQAGDERGVLAGDAA